MKTTKKSGLHFPTIGLPHTELVPLPKGPPLVQPVEHVPVQLPVLTQTPPQIPEQKEQAPTGVVAQPAVQQAKKSIGSRDCFVNVMPTL